MISVTLSLGECLHCAIVEGDPKDAICEASEELHADLLVMCGPGVGMIKRYLVR
jgi:nucleotide-binding universal stress UspA family protein